MAIRPSCLRLALLLFVGLFGAGCAMGSAGIATRDPMWAVESRDSALMVPIVASDVVIAIDHSALALLASEVDVDGDGRVGQTRHWVASRDSVPRPAMSWTTDSDDTIEKLQLEVARALVARLSDHENRVGLASLTLHKWTLATRVVRYTERPLSIVPVGPPDRVMAALADFPAVREQSRSDLSRLLETAADLLDDAPGLQSKRERAIVLLSLGEPSAPYGVGWSSREAARFAATLGERGIALWAVPFANANLDYLHELTRGTGGRVAPLEDLDALFGAPSPATTSSEPGP